MGKKDKKGLFKNIINIVKKSSEAERKKSEEKRKVKQSKPKGLRARRFGMAIFWALFLFMLLVTVVNIVGNAGSIAQEEVKVERNKLLDSEGLDFARNFVHDYFNWDTGKHGKDDLELRLSSYLMEDLDSFGGIRFNDEWSSHLDKRDIELKDIQEIDDTKARFTFRVDLKMKSKTDEKDTKIDENKLSFEEVLKEKSKVQVINGYKVKDMTKYISVPVYYSEEVDDFFVFEVPSFTFVEDKKDMTAVETNISKLQVLSDNYTENNVNSFLFTFFESYSKDSRDKLSYILEDPKHEYGLGGTMQFSKINQSTIYIIDDNHDRFLVDIEVEMLEPTTKYKFDNKFLVVVKRKDQRYVVESLNDEKYVYDLVEKYLEQFEDDELENEENDIDTEQNSDYEYQDERLMNDDEYYDELEEENWDSEDEENDIE